MKRLEQYGTATDASLTLSVSNRDHLADATLLRRVSFGTFVSAFEKIYSNKDAWTKVRVLLNCTKYLHVLLAIGILAGDILSWGSSYVATTIMLMRIVLHSITVTSCYCCFTISDMLVARPETMTIPHTSRTITSTKIFRRFIGALP